MSRIEPSDIIEMMYEIRESLKDMELYQLNPSSIQIHETPVNGYLVATLPENTCSIYFTFFPEKKIYIYEQRDISYSFEIKQKFKSFGKVGDQGIINPIKFTSIELYTDIHELINKSLTNYFYSQASIEKECITENDILDCLQYLQKTIQLFCQQQEKSSISIESINEIYHLSFGLGLGNGVGLGTESAEKIKENCIVIYGIYATKYNRFSILVHVHITDTVFKSNLFTFLKNNINLSSRYGHYNPYTEVEEMEYFIEPLSDIRNDLAAYYNNPCYLKSKQSV